MFSTPGIYKVVIYLIKPAVCPQSASYLVKHCSELDYRNRNRPPTLKPWLHKTQCCCTSTTHMPPVPGLPSTRHSAATASQAHRVPPTLTQEGLSASAACLSGRHTHTPGSVDRDQPLWPCLEHRRMAIPRSVG